MYDVASDVQYTVQGGGGEPAECVGTGSYRRNYLGPGQCISCAVKWWGAAADQLSHLKLAEFTKNLLHFSD